MAISSDWSVKQNIYILLVAKKGDGKTPASQVYLQPFEDLEKEEKKSFDQHKKRKQKEKKNSRKRQKQDDENEEEDSDTEDATGSSGDNSEKFMFHKKTRLADQITAEALMLSLHYGSGMLVIKADEFLVSSSFSFNFIDNQPHFVLQGFFTKCVERQDNMSAICSAFTGEVVKYTTVKRYVLTY